MIAHCRGSPLEDMPSNCFGLFLGRDYGLNTVAKALVNLFMHAR
jgi:hypothetical protein